MRTARPIADPEALRRHVLGSYLTQRLGMAALAAALPFVLLGIGRWHGLSGIGSFSEYYWAGSVSQPPGRLWFVGILFAVASFLYLYKGFTKGENVALNLAGLLAVCVAYFPMEVNCAPDDLPIDPAAFSHCHPGWNPHGTFAVLLFLCLAYVTFFRSLDTLPALPTEGHRRRFKALYSLTSVVLVAAPLTAIALHVLRDDYSTMTFWLEAAGVMAFSAYWAVKSVEMHLSSAEAKAAAGAGLTPGGKPAPAARRAATRNA